MIIVINPDGSSNLGDHHNTSNAHFHSELNHNELHHDWSHGFDNHGAHALELPTDPHALVPPSTLDAHALDAHSHHALDAHAPLEPTAHSFALSDEIQKHFVGAHETTHNAHALSFGATYTKNGQDIPVIIEDDKHHLFRTQHDGSAVRLCEVVKEGTIHYLCTKDLVVYAEPKNTYCRIEEDGKVYSDYTAGNYLGKVQEGNIYNSNGTFIGKADTHAQGAAHLHFLGA